MNKNCEGLTQDRLLKSYHLAAQIVSLYGEAYLPVFKRLHAEVEKMKTDEAIKDIAIRVASCNNHLQVSE